MKVRKSAVTLWVLVLLGMVIVSGCSPVTVETPNPAIAFQTTQTAIALAQLEVELKQTQIALAATQTAMPFTATPAAIAAQVEPTEEPTVEPTPTEEPTPKPTKKPTVEPTEEPTPEPTEEPTVEPTVEPTPVPTTEEPTAAPTPRVVNITGIICKVPAKDTKGFIIWLPPTRIDAHFASLGITTPFSATVRPVQPGTEALIGQWILLTVDSYDHSQGMRDRKDCDLSMSRDVRQALCDGEPKCDLDKIVDKPIEERIEDRTLDRTLQFVIEGE